METLAGNADLVAGWKAIWIYHLNRLGGQDRYGVANGSFQFYERERSRNIIHWRSVGMRLLLRHFLFIQVHHTDSGITLFINGTGEETDREDVVYDGQKK